MYLSDRQSSEILIQAIARLACHPCEINIYTALKLHQTFIPEFTRNYRIVLKIMLTKCLTQFKALNISLETTAVYSQEYPITVSMFGIGQVSRLNDRGLHVN